MQEKADRSARGSGAEVRCEHPRVGSDLVSLRFHYLVCRLQTPRAHFHEPWDNLLSSLLEL